MRHADVQKLREAYRWLDRDFRVLIRRCPDPSMWYVDRVGQWVQIEKLDTDGMWAREPSGCINIIKYQDVKP
jgi:hypothetical protein